MDPAVIQVVIAGVIEIIAIPLTVFVLERIIGRRLDKFDSKREIARAERVETERKIIEQRKAEQNIVLAIARTMLLDNWEKCMEKGFYSIEEREVYHKLYEAYREDNGNGIIEEIAPRIRALPMELPKN